MTKKELAEIRVMCLALALSQYHNTRLAYDIADEYFHFATTWDSAHVNDSEEMRASSSKTLRRD